MRPDAVSSVANEQRDAAFMSVGALQAAVRALESATPQNRDARDLWDAARGLAQRAMIREWEAAGAAP